MTIQKSLIEAASVISAPSEGDTWRVRLIQEGQGASGYYSAKLLEDYAHAFDGVVSYLNHTDNLATRNFTEIAGRVVGKVKAEKDKDGKTGLYAEWRPDDDHRAKLERYRDTLGLSIFINGEGYYDEERETLMVESFDADDAFRSVDVVVAPGANGRLLTESFKKMYEGRNGAPLEKASDTVSLDENGKAIMEEKLDKLIELMTSLVAEKAVKAEEAAQVEADAQAVEAAVAAYDEAVVQIDAAELLPSQVESLRAAAKAGADVAPLIESAKKVKEDALASIQATESAAPGRAFGERKVESAADLGKVFG